MVLSPGISPKNYPSFTKEVVGSLSLDVAGQRFYDHLLGMLQFGFLHTAGLNGPFPILMVLQSGHPPDVWISTPRIFSSVCVSWGILQHPDWRRLDYGLRGIKTKASLRLPLLSDLKNPVTIGIFLSPPPKKKIAKWFNPKAIIGLLLHTILSSSC